MGNMKVLHISVSGITDKFYLKFLSQMKEDYNFEQTIYIPYAKEDYSEKDLEILAKYQNAGVNPIALPIKTKSDRILYGKKIRKYAKKIEVDSDISSYQIIHAHSLFSDGGVAYLLKKKYNIPYIVAVRTTDVYIFMKYFRHIHEFGRKIVENAEKVIFITPSLKTATIENLYSNRNTQLLESKSLIIPNGVDGYWIDNKKSEGRKLSFNGSISLIQISRLNQQKNVNKTIQAIDILRKRGIDATLDILGEGKLREELEQLVNELGIGEYVHFRGYIQDLSVIKDYFEKNDVFVMPSVGETFGLSYIEAMTQGLPIIGVQHTGVSDYFEEAKKIGCFVETPQDFLIADAVETIIKSYDKISQNCVESVEPFDWKIILKNYSELYEGISRNKSNK